MLEATKKVINTFSALCLDNQICLTIYAVLGVICTFEANYGAIKQSILHRLLYSEGGATEGGLGGSYQAPFGHMQAHGRCFYMSFEILVGDQSPIKWLLKTWRSHFAAHTPVTLLRSPRLNV